MPQRVINTINKWGGNNNKTEYRANLEFRNGTKDKFEWDTEDDLDGLIEINTGIYPDLTTELPVAILEEYTLDPFESVETGTLDPNAIADAAATKSGIIHTP